jgi:aminoglycoside phosphotransferase (APT) family kinase protein
MRATASGDAAARSSPFSGLKPVEPRHQFDQAPLDRWMQANVEGYAGPLSVMQFQGGQSNPTYRLETPGGAYVLRRKPFGPLLPSAHALEREFRLIGALHGTDVPVARPYALCTDPDVIGAVFYIMQAIEGPIYWDGALPGLTPQWRRGVYESEIGVLARLHKVDIEAAGLGDYGRPGNYFARQVERWTRQYRASETDVIPEADLLMDWLPRTTPPQTRVSIVHGDYRLDNIVFHPDRPEVAAVLDWELSTLGDPLADFSYLLMSWVMPPDGRSGLAGLDLASLGVPSLDEAAALYCAMTGRDAIPDLNWYFAYNLFRLVGILQGIAGRVRDGTAASPHAAQMAARTPLLAKAAWDFAQKAGA